MTAPGFYVGHDHIRRGQKITFIHWCQMFCCFLFKPFQYTKAYARQEGV